MFPNDFKIVLQIYFNTNFRKKTQKTGANMMKTYLGLILIAIAVHSSTSTTCRSKKFVETRKDILNTLREIEHLKEKEIILKRVVAEMLVFGSKGGKRNAGNGKNKRLPFTSARAGKRGSGDKEAVGLLIENIRPPMMRGGKREAAIKKLYHGNTGPFIPSRAGKREISEKTDKEEEGPHYRLARLQRVGDSLLEDLIKAATGEN